MSGRGRGRGRGRVPTESVEPAPSISPTSSDDVPVLGRSRGRGRRPVAPVPSVEIGREFSPALEEQFKDVQIKDDLTKSYLTECERPGYGKFGKKIGLIVNYFPVELPRGKVYHYDVDIVEAWRGAEQVAKRPQQARPRRINPSVTRTLFKLLVSNHAAFRDHIPVYDGSKTLYTKRPLAISKATKFDILLEEDGRELKYVATVQPARKNGDKTAEVDLEPLHSFIRTGEGSAPMESIQALDIILRYGPSLSMVPIGRSFFVNPKKEDVPPFGGGRELWFGHYQSLKPTEWKPVLNINLTAATFYKRGPFLELASEFLGCQLQDLDKLEPVDLQKLKLFAKGLKVKVTHQRNARQYRVMGISKSGADNLTFDVGEGAETSVVTVAEYFASRYHVLKYPTFPCLIVPGRIKNAYIPMEVCNVTGGQPCRSRLDRDLTTKMIQNTTQTPIDKFKGIQCKLNGIIANSKPFLDEFGIKIDSKLATVEGRVLEPPTVIYEGSSFRPDRGSWNMSEYKFYKGAEIRSWQLINYGYCRMDQLRKFAQMLCSVAADIGLKIAPAQDIRDLSRERKLGVAEILKRVKERQPDLELVVIVVTSNSNKSNYADIKQAGDTKLGIITQCVQDKTVSTKCNAQVVSNICQKINAKMGGINNSIHLSKERPELLKNPVIIFGADVTHPTPGDTNFPSIAAVVANLDAHPSHFATRVRVQKSGTEIQARVEMILELKDMVKELLLEFYRHLHIKPEKIIFYRDGVSEGQFLEVLNFEVTQIRQACIELQSDYKPPLTFIVVQKRHHTRFCPENKRDGCGKAGNIPPGTTVDNKVTHPKDYDFYLCSHFGQQGTSRPTHYTVLWDENNISPDDIQMLSYHLCHTYARCTRSISNPVPAQYAHLAAYRARQHLQVCLDESGGSSGSGRGSNTNFEGMKEMIEKAVQTVQHLHDKMYYI